MSIKMRLPIGIQTFSEIIQEKYCYVDKTALIDDLVKEGKYYFLSRPRRFEKSLLVSTLKSAFSGQKELFEGLYLGKNWDWEVEYPVVDISFGGGVFESRKILDETIQSILNKHALNNNIKLAEDSIHLKFKELIQQLSAKYNQRVVILVDEYDKPILDNIEKPDIAIEVREGLKNFCKYSANPFRCYFNDLQGVIMDISNIIA